MRHDDLKGVKIEAKERGLSGGNYKGLSQKEKEAAKRLGMFIALVASNIDNRALNPSLSLFKYTYLFGCARS